MVDWVKGPRDPKNVIVPPRTKYLTLAGGRWQVHDRLPPAWPAEVRAVLAARGLEAYGNTPDDKWFLFATREPLRAGQGCFVFLYRARRGYAVRPGGPARAAGPKE